MIYRATIDAFTHSDEVAAVLEALESDSAFAMSRVAVHPGGLAAAVTAYAGRVSPQVVIIEDGPDGAATLATRLDQLAEVCDGSSRVIVIGHVNDIQLYRTLMTHGVSEYLVAPVTLAQIVDAVGRLFSDPAAGPRGKVMAFWGARGGAGSSTLAQNVAHALGSLLAEPVAYVDLDLAFGTSLLAFNIEPRQTVADALAQPERLDSVLLERLMVPHGEHVRVLASAADPRQSQVATLDGVDRLLDLVAGMAPVVVVDLPHLWSDWVEHVLAGADEAVVVSQPDLSSLRETKTLLEAIGPRRAGGTAPRIVINKFDAYRKTQLSPKDFAETLGVEPMLVVPFDPQLFGEAGNNGQMLSEAAKGHKVAEQIAGFAERLAGRSTPRKPAKVHPLLRFLQR